MRLEICLLWLAFACPHLPIVNGQYEADFISVTEFPRTAPFCVKVEEEHDLVNFEPIFKYHNDNPTQFIGVSPDKWQSPTGFINNITISRIYCNKSSPEFDEEHPWRRLHNYFHIVIRSNSKVPLKALYVQANSAPLGIPFGEFVTDFDCGDCGEKNHTSHYNDDIAVVPCRYRPATSFVQPNVFTINGHNDNPGDVKEIHFNFKYVDYPCYDITYAQFLIIAVRNFKGEDGFPLFETFYSPIFKVDIEGVGAPYPFYYGWNVSEVRCHDPEHSVMENWEPQQNQKVKLKYSAEFDECTYWGNKYDYNLSRFDLGPGVCPPGPVTCGESEAGKGVISDGKAWRAFRAQYLKQVSPLNGTDVFCPDCGAWIHLIGPPEWPQPNISWEVENITIISKVITQKPIVILEKNRVEECDNDTTERRDHFAKRFEDGSRNPLKDDCPQTFEADIATKGFRWGQNYILTLHTALFLFIWTVGSNSIIFTARFLKEASFAEKGSGCFGIGRWMWHHFFMTYICIAAMITGGMMMAFLDQEAICMIYDTAKDTRECGKSVIVHKVMGSMACLLFLMGYGTGWTRPQNKTLRNIIIYYHAACGYLAKYLGLFTMLTCRVLLDTNDIVWVCLLEVSFVGFFVAATILQRVMDSQMKFRVRERKMLPVPEGIDTFSEPPLKNARALLYPAMFLIQLTFYCFAAFNVWTEEVVTRF